MADLDWTVGAIAEMCGGRCLGVEDLPVREIQIDSRQRLDESLFVALRGERFDGHAFVGDAVKQGAVAVLVDHCVDDLPVSQIVVNDTLAALQRLGLQRRSQFPGAVFAITGSAGKTTTRNILASILHEGGAVHKPVKNFNNHIGVPLTLLELSNAHKTAVVELGCSDFGEIALLTRLSRPDVAVITNVGPAHLEKLGDLDGVARAKGELFAGLDPESLAVVNLDDPRVATMPVSARRIITYGESPSADVRLVEWSFSRQRGLLVYEIAGERRQVTTRLLGRHNMINALAAIAAAHGYGVEADAIARGLGTVVPEPGRLAALPGPRDTTILDDTYNANPLSTQMALDTAAELREPISVIAVLGDMLELGDAAPEAHQQVGRHAAELGVGLLVTVGELGAHIAQGARDAGMRAQRCVHLDSTDKVAKVVLGAMGNRDVVLVKGSRGMKMERIVKQLVASGE